jgi:hypothetical protein
MIFKIKNFMAYLENLFIPRSLKTTRNNRSSPHNGLIKKFFSLKSYYLCITNTEIVQNSKSKPNKFSFLCTFKFPDKFRRFFCSGHHTNDAGAPLVLAHHKKDYLFGAYRRITWKSPNLDHHTPN